MHTLATAMAALPLRESISPDYHLRGALAARLRRGHYNKREIYGRVYTCCLYK